MVACDFIYDGQYLSDYGFILCAFDDSSSLEIITAGSELTFNTVTLADGREHALTSTSYDTYFTATFQICKNPDTHTEAEMVITSSEGRAIMRWLNRKRFLKFKPVDSEWDDLYVEATFNISRIENAGKLYGFELQLITNRPFALTEPKTVALSFTATNYSDPQTVIDESDEIGYIYPSTMEITCLDSGTLRIHNDMEDRTMQILNCTPGEVVTLDCKHQIISSSLAAHSISTDFNYSFFRLANTYDCRENNISASIPCTIKFTYEPVAKVVF